MHGSRARGVHRFMARVRDLCGFRARAEHADQWLGLGLCMGLGLGVYIDLWLGLGLCMGLGQGMNIHCTGRSRERVRAVYQCSKQQCDSFQKKWRNLNF